MDDARRPAYLRAMGIALWERRQASVRDRADPVPTPLPSPVLTPLTNQDLPPMAAPGTGAAAEPPAPPALAAVRVPRRAEAKDGARAPLIADPAFMGWDQLEAAVSACRACGLCETRTQTVFGVGNRGASLLVIGEAPGADEDRAGEPFVGRAGQLLDRMLAALGLPRPQVYIANILKCRPPGNRDPRPEETLCCQPFLARQIELIGPRVVLALGRISAQALLGSDEPVGRLRGRWHELGPGSVALRVTYHPAYLLRSPDRKAQAWEDLTAVSRRLPPAEERR